MQVIAHLLTPLIEWVVPILTPFIGSIGPINVLILLALVAWVLVALAVAAIIAHARRALLKAISAYREWQARREAEARREADALIGADATPSVELCIEEKLGQIETLGSLCPAGVKNRIVEGFFFDQECVHPCLEHPECQLAH